MPLPSEPNSTSFDSAAPLGSPTPRLWTPPLRELTAETSYGFDCIDFADTVLRRPLDPWQRWLVIHAGELLPDGRPRFRTVLVLVARQNGKTELLVILSLYWLFVELQQLVLGTSTNLDYARESWDKAVALAEDTDLLAREIPSRGGIRRTNGEQTLTTIHRTRYKIAASNRQGGRSLTIARLILDELREHDSFNAWNASTPATNAIPDAQIWGISNQGDDSAVVLDSLRGPALEYIETGVGDERLGIFEWSAPNGADPEDMAALALANPNLGHRIDPDALRGMAMRAKAAGGQELAGFQTEIMCQRVLQLDPAIDPTLWDAAGTKQSASLAGHRDRVALCVDVALDGSHASLLAAAVVDGVVRVEVVKAWEGFGCTKALRAELPDIVRRVKPRALGWFPNGPAAAVAADLAAAKGPRRGVWPPRGVKVEALTAETTAVCMGLADIVAAGELEHPEDPMLTAHVQAAQKLRRGEAWAFTRRGTGPIDGAYALAGAVHLARTLPAPRSPLVAV